MEEVKQAAEAKAETKEEKRARRRAERAARRAKKKEEGGFWKDFKAFITRGNVIDLAVAVVVGAAFTAIVNSVVNDILQPLITWAFGGEDMSELVIILREASVAADGTEIAAITLNYGNLIMAIIQFLLYSLIIFTIVRAIRKAARGCVPRMKSSRQSWSRKGPRKPRPPKRRLRQRLRPRLPSLFPLRRPPSAVRTWKSCSPRSATCSAKTPQAESVRREPRKFPTEKRRKNNAKTVQPAVMTVGCNLSSVWTAAGEIFQPKILRKVRSNSFEKA